MKYDPLTMINKCSRTSNVQMTIDGETFPVKIKNISCDSSVPFDSTTTLTVEVDGHYHIPYYMMSRNQTNKPEITRVIFNKPATIVFWSDGTKTVVKCDKRDEFDPEKGLAMAIAKKSLGNNYKYYETIKRFLPNTYWEEETVGDLFKELMNEATSISEKLGEAANEQKQVDEVQNCSTCKFSKNEPAEYPCYKRMFYIGSERFYPRWTKKEG